MLNIARRADAGNGAPHDKHVWRGSGAAQGGADLKDQEEDQERPPDVEVAIDLAG